MIGRPLEEYFRRTCGGARDGAPPGRAAVEPGRLLATCRSRSARAKCWVLPASSAPGVRKSRPRSSGSTGTRPARSGCAASRLRPSSAAQAIALGIGLVPEDRKRQGLVLVDGRAQQRHAVDPAAAREAGVHHARRRARRSRSRYFERLRVKAPRLDTLVAALSGGNQQKIVLTKWLAARCPILILDEPTRGVDVGAKAEIHALIDELAAAGNAIILISSEMPEVLNLSTRILVFAAAAWSASCPARRRTRTR